MRNIAVLALSLLLTSSSAAATAPDALVIGTGGELRLVDGSGTVATSLGGFTPSADWSPDGTRFAFLRQSATERGLFVAAADGSGVREVARQSNGEVWASVTWISSSDVVLYSIAARSSFWSIRVLPIDGGSERLLVQQADLNFPPALQPGGFLLVYSTNIFRRAVVDLRTGVSRLLPVTGSELAWSPDGSLLAVPRADGIDVIRPDGSDRRTVLPVRAIRSEVSVQSPAWSPDGSRIAFTRRQLFPELQDRFGTPARTEIWSVGADGSGPTRLTGVAGDELYAGGTAGSLRPSWWPDGSRRTFRRSGAEAPFMTMNADGSCETPWPGPFGVSPPVWRPGAFLSVGRKECSSVIVRLRTPLAEVSHRGVLPLTITLRNDGTRILRDVQLSLEATQGSIAVPELRCGPGSRLTCPLGVLEPGRELVLQGRTTFASPGRTRVTASTSYAGGGDVDPTDDTVDVLRDVSPCDVLGTWAADRLIGTRRGEWICGRPGSDYIDGRGGNDTIEAGSGVDTVVAGPGRDSVDGGGGGDTIRVRDGERDFVDCGTETDIVVADRKDVLRHCERVSRR